MNRLILLAIFAVGCNDEEDGAPVDDASLPVDAVVEDEGVDPLADAVVPDGGPIGLEEHVLAYDDGRGEYFEPGAVGDAVAVRFSLPAGGKLDEVMFRVFGDPAEDELGRVTWRSRGPFEVQVLAADGDAPGTPIHPTDGTGLRVEPMPPAGGGVIPVDLRPLDIDVPPEFFVVMRWLEAGTPHAQHLGFDGSEPNGRTWMYRDDVWQPIEEIEDYRPLDAMIRATVRTPAGAMEPPTVTLTNIADDCHLRGAAGAWPEGAGFWTATRIEAPFDLDVKLVQIQLHHAPDLYMAAPFDGACNAATPFEVVLYRSSEPQPAEEPMGIERITVPAAVPDGDPSHQIRLPLSTPLALHTGEFLFVAVQMARPVPTNVICVRTCRDPAKAGRDFWSTATVPPLGWTPFEEFDVGGPSNLDIEVVGHQR